MNPKIKHTLMIWAVPVLVGSALAVVAKHYFYDSIDAQMVRQAKIMPPVHFTTVSVALPNSLAMFPPGDGAVLANSNCMMCHSVGMVLRQPPLTKDEWRTEVLKMKNLFGAPIAAENIDKLAHYLRTINGRDSDSKPSTLDAQGS
jgi:mono/diheme cytochrome c family protein